jgi:hypothetical protein
VPLDDYVDVRADAEAGGATRIAALAPFTDGLPWYALRFMAARSRATGGCRVRVAFLVVCVALGAWVALAPGHALAAGRVQFLTDRLRYPPPEGQPDDFRVRTNAALALGATNDDDAVMPLCGGLDDPSELVRQAAAVALKRLARAASLDCLRRRVEVETVVAARQKMQQAIEACEASAASSGPPAPTAEGYVAGAKYYVSLSPVANGTTRSRSDVERTVRAAIASRLGQLGEYQLAPLGEASDTAKSVIAKRKLKGFYLSVNLEKLDYADGTLRVRVKIAVFSYPGRDLRGEVPAEGSIPGVRTGDSGSEDQLIGLVASRAVELFAQNFR